MEEELLRTVSENTAALTGSDYFVELAKFVSHSLNVRFAMVCKWSNAEKTKLTMLAYVDRKETLQGFEYETEGTPCKLVMQGNEFFCSEHLHIKYPREKMCNRGLQFLYIVLQHINQLETSVHLIMCA